MAWEYLEGNTYETLLAQALSKVPDTMDKRQGSIIYDALAPACYELAEFYMELIKILNNTYVETASGTYLDLRVSEQGITRLPATYSVKKGTFVTQSDTPAVIPIGSRFSSVSEGAGINYTVIEPYTEDGVVVPGSYRLRCETIGTVGNDYVGQLLPLNNISSLKFATLSEVLIPARDEETDDELRTRYYLRLNQKPFGGNVSQYDELLKDISGVGGVQIYPVWNGGGTVKCSIVDTQYNAVSNDFLATVQNTIDPDEQGTGLGTAPIGHKVTITTPTKITADVEALVTLKAGFTISQIQSEANRVVADYLLELRELWGVASESGVYELTVYVSRLIAALLSVSGIANVRSVKINNSTEDLVLTQNSTTQQIPILGEVSISE